jgi:pentatricopeptide repeat protein
VADICSFLGKIIYIAKYLEVYLVVYYLFLHECLNEYVAMCKPLFKYIFFLEIWRQVEKIKRLPHARPLEVTFTGMIRSSMDGGHIDDCICIFEYMQDHCAPNVGTVNTMLKVYSQNDMFSTAKVLFEEVKVAKSDLRPDAYTYNLMLGASSCAHQWEYFEHVYKEMILSGYHLDQNKHLPLLVKASRAGKVDNILVIYIRSRCLFYISAHSIISYKNCYIQTILTCVHTFHLSTHS